MSRAREKRAEQRKRDMQERLEEEKKEKEELMDDVFKCWLRKKKDELRSAVGTRSNVHSESTVLIYTCRVSQNSPHHKPLRTCVLSLQSKDVHIRSSSRSTSCELVSSSQNREEVDDQSFRMWLKKKREQKKRERYVESKRLQELERAHHVPDRQTCEQAYKQ